jgi:uncharacterized membrane-anchored protein
MTISPTISAHTTPRGTRVPRRRTNDTVSSGAVYGCLIIIGVFVLLGIIETVIALLLSHPGVGFIVLTILAGAAGLAVKLLIDRQQRARAWAAEQQRITYLRSMEIAPTTP